MYTSPALVSHSIFGPAETKVRSKPVRAMNSGKVVGNTRLRYSGVHAEESTCMFVWIGTWVDEYKDTAMSMCTPSTPLSAITTTPGDYRLGHVAASGN